MEVEAISNFHHPRKVGLSDAYLESPSGRTGNKRVIHEYHRIEVEFNTVSSGVVIVFDPKKTCISQKTCETCKDIEEVVADDPKDHQPPFKCGWCVTSSGEAFCSDDSAKHRFNELYMSECADNPEHTCAPVSPVKPSTEPSASSPSPASTAAPSGAATSTQAPERSSIIPGDKKPAAAGDAARSTASDDEAQSGHSGTLVLIIAAVALLCCGAWVGYAYMNPTSPSGQCLIRYRPSRWRMPNSDVRYTASVHM